MTNIFKGFDCLGGLHRCFLQIGRGTVVGLVCINLAACASSNGQPVNASVKVKSAIDQKVAPIKLNQIGYQPSAEKVAIVPLNGRAKQVSSFVVIRVADSSVVQKGVLSEASVWPFSKEAVRQADFSTLNEPGEYVIRAQYAGVHARGLGHPDTNVKVHRSAATSNRPEGTIVSAPGGWYDAGDYGKYIVNSGISTYTLLSSYQHFKRYYQSLNLAIPESTNDVPDIVDEIKWNLDWMEKMQDVDGGVYHKLTLLKFSDIDVAPADEKKQRFVIGKSVTATLNFAAVMSVASRVMQEFDGQFPGVARRYENAALRAYDWAKRNPDALYEQPDDVATGAYGDKNANDEFSWAAAELFLLTGDATFFAEFMRRNADPGANLSWPQVSALGYVSLANFGQPMLSEEQYSLVVKRLLQAADKQYQLYQDSAYGVAAGLPDFEWGSNSNVLNNGMVLFQAYRLTGDDKYKTAAMSTVDYVLGKNASGFSFVTGHGDHTPLNIHHRPSVADDTPIPVPGFIAGGPHTGRQDKCDYPGDQPATNYVDTVCSYSTNEIAINWNAPLVYMLAAANNID